MRIISIRVAARYQRAHEFPTDKALKHYLHDHPGADPKNHTVKEHGSHETPGKPKKSWKDLVTSLSAKAKSFVQQAPAAVKSFIHDEGFRNGVLQKAHSAIEAAPAKFVHRVIDEAKEEAHEIGQAGQGLAAVLRGRKMSDHQKEAIKKVGTHILIATLVTALTGGLGIGAAGLAKGSAGAFTSSLAKKIALKAITPKLSSLPTMEELAHGGHGAVHHLFDHFTNHLASEKEEDLDPKEVFAEFVASIAAEALKDLDPETVREALEEMEVSE